MDTNFSTWTSGQVVTGAQMTSLTQDLYNKLQFLTESQAPCILFIDGEITQAGGNVSVPYGYFRFADNTISQLPYQTAIFGSAPAATVAVTGNGWIVARYSVTPSIPGAINYSFPTSYVFTTSAPLITDCIVCIIASGVIGGYGQFAVQNFFSNGTSPGGTIITLSTISGTPLFYNFTSTIGGVTTVLTNDTGNEINLFTSNNSTSPTAGTYGRIATYCNTGSLPLSEAFMAAGYNGVPTNRIDVYAGDGTPNSAYRATYTQNQGYAPPTQDNHVLVAQDFAAFAGSLNSVGDIVNGNYMIYQITNGIIEIRMNAICLFTGAPGMTEIPLTNSTFAGLPSNINIPGFGTLVCAIANMVTSSNPNNVIAYTQIGNFSGDNILTIVTQGNQDPGFQLEVSVSISIAF